MIYGSPLRTLGTILAYIANNVLKQTKEVMCFKYILYLKYKLKVFKNTDAFHHNIDDEYYSSFILR